MFNACPQSRALSCVSNAPWAKKVLDQVRRHGCLHDLTCYFAPDYGIFSSEDRVGGFNEQWVFENLLVHEMELGLLDSWMFESISVLPVTCGGQ